MSTVIYIQRDTNPSQVVDINETAEFKSTVISVEQNLIQKALLKVLNSSVSISQEVTSLNFVGDISVTYDGEGVATVTVVSEGGTDTGRLASVAYILKTFTPQEEMDGSITYADAHGVTNMVKTFPADMVVLDYDYNGEHYTEIKDFS